MWQLFVKDLEGCTKSILFLAPEHTSVQDVKNLVGLDQHPNSQLVHGSRLLQDSHVLTDYPTLSHGSTLYTSVPLLGGAERGSRVRANPEIDPNLPRSNEEHCMITNESFEMNGTIVLLMPCGHPISPGGLVDYCWSELNANKTAVCCLLCSNEWGLVDIKRYSGMSDKEYGEMEKRLGRNFCLSNENIKKCPKCKSYVSRMDEANPNVVCQICTKKLGRAYHFCWHCRREWVNNTGRESCGFGDCKDGEKLQELNNSEKILLRNHPQHEMYAKRACPCCGNIIRSTSGVKRTQCPQCDTEFCLFCLRPRSQLSWFCDSDRADCQLAPIQRKIPHIRDLQEHGDDGGAQNNPPAPPPPPANNPPAPQQPNPAGPQPGNAQPSDACTIL